MSRYGNSIMDDLYDNIANCGLNCGTAIRVFGDALSAMVRNGNDNLETYKWKVGRVLYRISEYPEDIRDKSFISIKELEELIK